MRFSETLKALMEEHEESNYALAKALEISQSTVANWLNEVTTPTRPHIKLLEQHYGIKMGEET